MFMRLCKPSVLSTPFPDSKKFSCKVLFDLAAIFVGFDRDEGKSGQNSTYSVRVHPSVAWCDCKIAPRHRVTRARRSYTSERQRTSA